MAKRTTPEEAVQILLKHGLKPLVPYVNSKTRWKSTHLECGTTCFPMLEKATKDAVDKAKAALEAAGATVTVK